MSKKGKKASNKRGRNSSKITKPRNPTQPTTDELSQDNANRTHEIVNLVSETSGTSSLKVKQFTSTEKDEIAARDSGAGSSILARYLAGDPCVSARDYGAGPSNISRETEPIDLSMNSGANPVDAKRDLGAGHGDYAWSSNSGSDCTWLRDSGAGPSTWSRDSGGPSTQDLPRSSLDDDERLKSSIVSKFLGVPKCVLATGMSTGDLEKTAKEQKSIIRSEESEVPFDKHKNQSEKGNTMNVEESEVVSKDFITTASKLKRKIDEPKASTSKQEYQVSTSFLDKPNDDQLSQLSSSISEKACGRVQVITSSDVETLAHGIQKCDISTTATKLEIRRVQDIEKEILQMDVAPGSNNSPDFGREYIQKLAASLLEPEAPIVLDSSKPPAIWRKNKSRVPYVFLHPPFDFKNHMKKVLEQNIQFYLPKRGTHYTKILCRTLDDKQKLTQYFDEYRMPYHTFGPPSDKMIKVVIRGLSGDIDLVKIKEELIAASISVVRLHKMRYNGMHKSKWHILLAVVPRNKEGLKLLSVMKIFGQGVTMERAKSKAEQCHRCQRWGHAQRFCQGRVRCVKCAGEHFPQQCTRDPNDDPLCANCGGDHAASYRKCFYCPDSEVYKNWQMRKRSHRHKYPLVLATPENCDVGFVSNQEIKNQD